MTIKSKSAFDVTPNPRASAIERISYVVASRIQNAVIDALGGDGSMLDDWRGVSRDGCYGLRPASDEECGKWSFDLTLHGAVDLRKRLPPQMADLLKAMAVQLLRASDAVASLEDDRPLKLIRAIVDDHEFLEGVQAEGLEFDHDGNQVPIGESSNARSDRAAIERASEIDSWRAAVAERLSKPF